MSKLIWLTGLSGSGKTTIGRELYKKLKNKEINTIFLDGDDFRDLIGNDLKYNIEDRLKNAIRIHKVCRFLTNQNINVVCSTMSLFEKIHQLNRDTIENYFEILIECNLNELIKRDQKGIYSQALTGKRNDVIGINQEFEIPIEPTLRIDNTKKNKLNFKVDKIIKLIYNED